MDTWKFSGIHSSWLWPTALSAHQVNGVYCVEGQAHPGSYQNKWIWGYATPFSFFNFYFLHKRKKSINIFFWIPLIFDHHKAWEMLLYALASFLVDHVNDHVDNHWPVVFSCLSPNTFGRTFCGNWGLAAVLQEKASSIQKQLSWPELSILLSSCHFNLTKSTDTEQFKCFEIEINTYIWKSLS